MRILLTGAAGFIGTHIGDVARERGHEVVARFDHEHPLLDAHDPDVLNGAEIAGRIIALMLMLGVPIVLGVLLTVRSSRLYKRAAAIELRDASSY